MYNSPLCNEFAVAARPARPVYTWALQHQLLRALLQWIDTDSAMIFCGTRYINWRPVKPLLRSTLGMMELMSADASREAQRVFEPYLRQFFGRDSIQTAPPSASMLPDKPVVFSSAAISACCPLLSRVNSQVSAMSSAKVPATLTASSDFAPYTLSDIQDVPVSMEAAVDALLTQSFVQLESERLDMPVSAIGWSAPVQSTVVSDSNPTA